MKKLCSTIIVVASMGLIPAALSALTLHSQGHTFDVRVRNSSFQTVTHARGSVWISGTTAQIHVDAGGYRTGRATVFLRDNQKYYTCDVRLDDPSIFYRVRNASGQMIPGAYARKNDIGVWGDEFRFEVRLPKSGYEAFKSQDVNVQCSGGFVFGQRVYVYDLGMERRVEITVKRRDMGQSSTTFTVTIPSNQELREHRRDIIRALTFQLRDQVGEVDDIRRGALTERLADLKRIR